MLMKEKLLDQVLKSFQWKIVQMGNLQKVAKFHTNPSNFVACLRNPYKLSILGDIWRAALFPFSSKTGLLDHAIQEFSLVKPSWVMSLNMLYVYGKFMHDFYFISVFNFFFLGGGGWGGGNIFMITSNLALYASLAFYHTH